MNLKAIENELTKLIEAEEEIKALLQEEQSLVENTPPEWYDIARYYYFKLLPTERELDPKAAWVESEKKARGEWRKFIKATWGGIREVLAEDSGKPDEDLRKVIEEEQGREYPDLEKEQLEYDKKLARLKKSYKREKPATKEEEGAIEEAPVEETPTEKKKKPKKPQKEKKERRTTGVSKEEIEEFVERPIAIRSISGTPKFQNIDTALNWIETNFTDLAESAKTAKETYRGKEGETVDEKLNRKQKFKESVDALAEEMESQGQDAVAELLSKATPNAETKKGQVI